MIEAALAASHAPFIVGARDRADQAQADRFYAGYATAAERIRAARPDAVVIVTAEHFTNFFDVVPPFHINIGEFASGPVETHLGIPHRRVPGDPDLALRLLDAAAEQGVDVSFGRTLQLDHGAMVPLHLLEVPEDTPVVPILVNCLVEPMPRYERCRALGAAIGSVLEGLPTRVALIAAGGLSHWPGMPEAGRISEDWDRAVLSPLGGGDRSVLWDPPTEGADAKGPGAEELRAWTIVGAATGDGPAEVLTYEPITGWSTGCAVVDLLPNA